MGDPMMCEIDERMIADYRSRRLDSGIKASTINHDLFALSAVLKAMTEIGEYHGGNPVLALPRLKEKAPEMSYLTTEEIEISLYLWRQNRLLPHGCFVAFHRGAVE